ncbi:hypothetical protein SAMN05421841_3616 [Chryseobacterium wanjuense]|jgi:hypothetical protein|uniref:MBG domain-containing protein n=1 Tax=Chryseobacterium wanjuense TaxID=356305 RepID=A0A1I0S0H4_9FLAO|nr:hypothetical protein [Chryseobacterium wanjuense]SEW47762.1 hypothetical protein SAMN05421841_3616 [Chryseobacterium wanjuense]
MRKFLLTLTLPFFGIVSAQSGNIGLNTANPGSTLDINGSLAAQYKTVSASTYAMTSSDFYIAYTGTTNSVFTLPTAIAGVGNFKGRMYTVKNNTAFTVTINSAAPETINGSAGITVPAGQSVELISTGLTGAVSAWELSGFRSSAFPLTTASNGLNAVGTDVRLGGTLSQATDIATAGNNLIVSGTGNVGIGSVAAPVSKLEVNGSSTNAVSYNAAAATTIDFSRSNLAYTTANPGAFTLQNVKDGGTYTLSVRGATAGTSTFTATGFTVRYINNRTTVANTHTLYTLVVIGTVIYVYIATAV